MTEAEDAGGSSGSGDSGGSGGGPNASGRVEAGPAAEVPISLSQAILAPLDAVFRSQLHAARSFLNMVLQLGYPDDPGPDEAQTGADQNAPGDAGDGERAAAAPPDPGDDDDEHAAHRKAIKDFNDKKAFEIEFHHAFDVEVADPDAPDGARVERHYKTIGVPAISLVPIAPLAVKEAEFSFEMSIQRVESHDQMQRGRKGRRNEAVRPEDMDEEARKEAEEGRPWYMVRRPVDLMGVVAAPQTREEAGGLRQEGTVRMNVKVGATPMPAGLDRLLSSLSQMGHQETIVDPPPPRRGSPSTTNGAGRDTDTD